MNKIFFTAFSVALICATSLHAQIINTIAGTGAIGFSGDGGPAISATFNTPTDVAIASNGDIYVADRLNYRIRKIDGSGIIYTVAGTGTPGYNGDGISATAAEINNVWSISVDTMGNLYLADADNNRVRMVDTAGIIHTIAGTGIAGYSGDGGAATSAQLSSPVSVTLDVFGNLYIADHDNYRIRKVSTSGIISSYAGTGLQGSGGDGGPATSASFGRLSGIAYDKLGNLFIADDDSRIRKIDTSGTINTVAGNGMNNYNGDGILAASASIAGAVGIAVDTFSNYYIVDAGHFRIRKVNNGDTINTIAGTGISGFSGDGGQPTAAQLISSQMRVLPNGNIYLADVGNSRIRVIDYTLSTGSAKNTANDMTLFPNPNNGSFNLSGSLLTKSPAVQITISDLTGKIVLNYEAHVQNGHINKQIKLSSTAPAGKYLLTITTEQGTTTLKFEKK